MDSNFLKSQLDLESYLKSEIPKIAELRHKQYPRIEAEDFEAEMWYCVIQRGDEVIRRWELGDDKRSLQTYLENSCRDLWLSDQKYQKACRAIRLGYKPEDVQTYNRRQLRLLLPVYFDSLEEDGSLVLGKHNDPDNSGGVPTSIKGESGGLLTMLMDTHQAMGKLSRQYSDLLADYFRYYGGSNPEASGFADANGKWVSHEPAISHESIARKLGVDEHTLTVRVSRALDKLAERMNRYA